MKAFITGIAGQDGWYLARHLAGMGYEVSGMDAATPSLRDAAPSAGFVTKGDVTDAWLVRQLLGERAPDEVYHLAALNLVTDSWDAPWRYHHVNVGGTLAVLEAARTMPKPPKVFVAASSGMFGLAPAPQHEGTPMHPLTPYDGSKLAAYHLARMYRLQYGLPVTCGILYQHESPRKRYGVFYKVCAGVRAIKDGRVDELVLGDQEIVRDWCHADDMVRAMRVALLQPPDDWVIGSSDGRRVWDVVRTACGLLGVDVAKVRTDPALARPNDPPALVAAPRKFMTATGWHPLVGFTELVAEQVGLVREGVTG